MLDGSFPIPQLGETGSLDDPAIAKMHYKVNCKWPSLSSTSLHCDNRKRLPLLFLLGEAERNLAQPVGDLSGRFYHYMGMYAPPIGGDAPGEWLNRWNPFGAGGGRLTYNVSYTTGPWSVEALYSQAQELGFATLAYCNVFEFGMNILGHASGAAVAPKPDDYRNATLYAQNHLAGSILQANWNNQDGSTAPNQGAWDGGVLMDPGREQYKNEMAQQEARRMMNIPSFQGIVVDRSDYARFYNLLHDDGVTLTPGANNQSWSMKRSYLEVIEKIRGVFGAEKVMLMNSLGYSSLSMMPSYDGTFSEGRAINAVGILGAGGMVNIMWTSNNLECCPNEPFADQYFQQRLYMGVYPMAPLPAADHCIGYNKTIVPWFVNYGPLYKALAGKTFNLAPHAVSVVAGAATSNAFLNNGSYIYPIAMATSKEVTLQLEAVDTAVVRFEFSLPGPTAGEWRPVAKATKNTKGWRVTVEFEGIKAHHAALVRSRTAAQ
eukprot:SAG22_NODE_552_length_9177_cov_15.661489_4_plen_490_part_00